MRILLLAVSLFTSIQVLAIGQVALCESAYFHVVTYTRGGNSINCDDCYLRRAEEEIVIGRLEIKSRHADWTPNIIEVTEPKNADFFLRYENGAMSAVGINSNQVIASTTCRRMTL